MQGECTEFHGEGTRLGDLAQRWVVDGIEFNTDEAQKELARADIRKHLSSPNHDELHVAVLALRCVPEALPDADEARRVLLPLLGAREPALWIATLAALRAWARLGDLQLVLDVAGGLRGSDRSSLVRFLAHFSGFELTGEAGRVALEILREVPNECLESALNGLGRANTSEEIEAFLLQESHSEDAERARCIVAHGLSLLKDKSEPVVERLLADVCEYRDVDSRWACGGLSYGVPLALQPRVCDVMIELLPTCTEWDWDTRSKYLHVLETYGRERHAAALEVLAAAHSNSCHARSRFLDVARVMRWREQHPTPREGS